MLLSVAVMAPRTLLLVVGCLSLLFTVALGVQQPINKYGYVDCMPAYFGSLYIPGVNEPRVLNVPLTGLYCLSGITLESSVTNYTARNENRCQNGSLSSAIFSSVRHANGHVPRPKCKGGINLLSCEANSRLVNFIRYLGLYPAASLGFDSMCVYILASLYLGVLKSMTSEMITIP
ncbi:Cy67 [Cynomolgus cytomegalovirus]|nr:Cy67 [Cynomolgus cytomegalovirus]